jgi:DNA-binding MarR family transcriptional regulator
MNHHTHVNGASSPSEGTTISHAASVLANVLAEQPSMIDTLYDQGDELDVPMLLTGSQPGDNGFDILFCNTAFCDMCGYTREELVGRPPSMLQGPETDQRMARNFVERLAADGHAGTVLLNYRGDGTPYFAEIMAVRAPRPAALNGQHDGSDVFVAFERSLGDLERGEGITVSRPYRLALQLESVMRRYLQRNYHRGMHPAQWSALRYFKLAASDKRSLSDFAKAHRTTMGTASTTVSTLVGKGYLVKRGFRGPIELTEAGEQVLANDPLDEVVGSFARLDDAGAAWAERILLDLAERLADEEAPEPTTKEPATKEPTTKH